MSLTSFLGICDAKIGVGNVFEILLRVGIEEWQIASDHSKQNNPAAPNIGGKPVPFPKHHLRHGTTALRPAHVRRALDNPAQSKIDHPNVLKLVKKNVFALDIPVRDVALAVQIFYRADQLNKGTMRGFL
jgi:hypothetical protein